MSHKFLTFADEIITLAEKAGSIIYDDTTRGNYSYYFDEDDSKLMHAMSAIANVYGFVLTPIKKKGDNHWDDEIILGFRLDK